MGEEKVTETKERARYLAGKLRCSNTPQPHDCTECEYRTEERIPFKLRKMADFWRGYEPYCIGCDYEQIAFDASDMLEVLAGG